MKQLLIFVLFASCLVWLDCTNHVSNGQAVHQSDAQAVPSGVKSEPPVIAQEQQQKQGKPRDEQLHFGAEEAIRNPTSVSEEVLQILRRDERNQTCLAANELPSDIPASWFVASEVSLNRDGLTDLVVTAANPCLFGANINPFWIFHGTPRGQQLVLSVSALSLEVLDTRTKGFRDIRASAATATEVLITVYSFNGGEYRRLRSSREPISK
jgi:hypothetical protein